MMVLVRDVARRTTLAQETPLYRWAEQRAGFTPSETHQSATDTSGATAPIL